MKRRDVEPHITDHAVVRWLERVRGVDIAAVRKEIADHCREGVAYGASKVRLEKTEFILVDDAVVTIQKIERPR